jgi:calcineurin-like phosphoesterase
MFRRFCEVVVTFVFGNWFMAAAPTNPFVEADDVVQTASGGDLIEFQRKKFCLFPYKHWAVYIGDQ